MTTKSRGRKKLLSFPLLLLILRNYKQQTLDFGDDISIIFFMKYDFVGPCETKGRSRENFLGPVNSLLSARTSYIYAKNPI